MTAAEVSVARRSSVSTMNRSALAMMISVFASNSSVFKLWH